MESLSVAPTWFARVLRAVGILRIESPTDFAAGTDFARNEQAIKPFSSLASMSTFSEFPWVKASVDKIGEDIAGLPMKAKVAGTQVPGHEVIDLLKRPHTQISGELFRRQMIVDLLLDGNWYGLKLRQAAVDRSRIVSLRRLHPIRTTVRADDDGTVQAYIFDLGDGEKVEYLPKDVVHIRSASWEDGPAGLYGQGIIRALRRDLAADLAAQENAARAARTGRPDAIVSPKNEDDRWGKKLVEKIKDVFNRKAGTDAGGIWVLGGAVSYKPMSFNQRDMEFIESRKLTRETVLATVGTPPTVVGLPTANYATSREQNRIYWTSIVALARLIEGGLNEIAAEFGQGIAVFHDFSGVGALQVDRTERQDRVVKWVELGMLPDDAAMVEGFDELPGFPNAIVAVDATVAEARSIIAEVAGGDLPAQAGVLLLCNACGWKQNDAQKACISPPTYPLLEAAK